MIDFDLLPRERVFFEGPIVCLACRGRGVVESRYHVVTIFADGTRRDGWPCRLCGARGYREGRVIREKIPKSSPEQERQAMDALIELAKAWPDRRGERG
jgi:hypothetical protein